MIDLFKIVGVAFTSNVDHCIRVCEFTDNELFSNLEALLVAQGVRECLIPDSSDSNAYDVSKIKSVLEKCDVVITPAKNSDYSATNLEQDLDRLLKGDIPVLSRRASFSSVVILNFVDELQYKTAMSCVACLIQYLSLTSDDSNFGAYLLHKQDLNQYMRLDSSVSKALNLFPSASDGSDKYASVYGILNHCVTTMGSRLLMQWLKQPLLDVQAISTFNLHEIVIKLFIR